MAMRRAASEMDPVAAMASRRSALPGPMAISGPNTSRSFAGPSACRGRDPDSCARYLARPERFTTSGSGPALFRRFGDELLQLARVVHVAHDVAAADEFAVHIELRNGGPVGEM